MAHVVTEICIKCKYAECIEVCPQGAFREGKNFVVIDPNACANCALCEIVCPVDAIFADYALPKEQQQFQELNRTLAQIWPVAEYREPPEDAEAWVEVPNKFRFLSMEGYTSNL